MKKTTRVWSALLAILMILTVCPVMALSAQDVQAVAAPEYWNGAASSSTTTVTDVMAFVQAGTAYTATVTDLEGHLIIDTDKKEIHIVDELGFAIFVIMTNNPYTIYEADGTTVKYDGERETAIDTAYGISDIVAYATIYLDNDLYLNDPAKDVSTWKSTAPMFMRPIPNIGGKNGSLTFDGQGHSITGWYCNIALTSADHGASFGLFGMPVVYDFLTVKNVALLAQKLNITANNTWTNTIVAGSVAAGAWIVGGECNLTVDSVVIDSKISASIQAKNSTGGNITGQMWTSTQTNAKAENKNLVVSGVVGCPQNRPSSMTQSSNIVGTTTLTNIVVKTDITESSSNRAWGAGIFTNDRAVNLKLENIVALSTAHGFTEANEEFAPSFIRRLATFTSLSYKNVFVNGALHTDMADTTYGSNFSTTATADDLLPYNIYKQQRDKGAFWGWDIEGEIAVPATLASQATAIDAILNTDTTEYWDGTVPGIVDGVEVDNILAEGESLLDYVISGKEYVLSKAQFAAHLTHAMTTTQNAAGNLTILDEIGFAMYVLMSNNSFKVMDGETVWYNGARAAASGTLDGFFKLFYTDKTTFLARDLYMNDPAKPVEEWNSLAPITMRHSANAKNTAWGVMSQTRFDGKGHTIDGWYVKHTVTAEDQANSLVSYGFFGTLWGSYTQLAQDFALTNAKMDLTAAEDFTGTILAGGLMGSLRNQASSKLSINKVAIEMEIAVTPNESGYYWYDGRAMGVSVGAVAGTMSFYDSANGFTAVGSLTLTDSLFAVKMINRNEKATSSIASGITWSVGKTQKDWQAPMTVTISDSVFYPTFEGFAAKQTTATIFGSNVGTSALTNVLLVGELNSYLAAGTGTAIKEGVESEVTRTAAGVRTIGSLDLTGGVFAQNKGEGFANWSTDGDVAVPTSFLADAAAFGDAILTDSAIRALGVSIRNTTTLEKQGLRFSVEVNLDALTAAGYTLKYGALFIPAREVNMKGSTLEVDTENVLDFGEYDIRLLEAEDDGASASMWTYENAKQFNCAIVNLPQLVTVGGQVLDTFNVDFAMRGYVQVLDGEGEVIATVYTRTVTASLVDVARYIVENEAASEEVIENLLVLIERAEQALQAA